MDSLASSYRLVSQVVLALAAMALLFAAAAMLLRWQHVRRARTWKGLEMRWEGLILDVLAGDADAEALHAIVRPREAAYFLNILLRFFRQLRGAERDVLVSVAQPYLPSVARQRHARSNERRARAVQTLSLLGGDAYLTQVREALDDPSPLVAMVAARALARRRDPGLAAAILPRLERLRIWQPRFLAAMLAELGPDASPALFGALADPGRPAWVRAVAADALRVRNDLAAADVAATVLTTASDRELAAACLRLLGALGRPEHVPLVRERTGSPDPTVRAMAFRALAGLGGPDDTARFGHALEDPSPWVALEAARGLARTGGRATLQAFAVTDSPRADVAREALLDGAA